MSPRKRQVTYSRRPSHAARSAHARGDREFRQYDTSYIQPKQNRVPFIIAVIVVIVVIAAIVFGIVALVNSCSSGSGGLLSEDEQATVVVEEGEAAPDVADSLVEAKLISSASEFTDRVNELGVDNSLKPGTYTITGGTDVDGIINTLKAGPGKDNALTVPEGYTLEQIADAVQEATDGRITSDDFAKAASDASVYASDYSFLKDAGTNKLEGFLFPKTYGITEDATADDIIRMMLDQYQSETVNLDYSYPKDEGLSKYDVLILASIVEKESSDDNDIRAQVASVFYNRLKTEGEPSYGLLQSDATTAYEVGHDPTADDINTDGTYNTYLNKGLPPTPICSPGIEALEAVCSPADTDYYFFYFTTDDNGELEYSFSKTYEEHQKSIS